MPAIREPEQTCAHVIAVASGKGGVGKSTLAVNLSIALAQTGAKVCLFDADTNLANINILLGISPSHTLEHFLNNALSITEVVTKGPGGIDIVAGASGVSEFIQLSVAQQKKLVKGLRLLEHNYHYLLLDTAAGIDKTNLSFMLAAPYLLLTITGEPTSLTDAFSLLRVLKKSQFSSPILVIVNMSNNQRAAQATFKRFKMAVNTYLQIQNIFLAGTVLADKNVPVSIFKQQPVLLNFPDSPASQGIMQISHRLLNAFNKKKDPGKNTSTFSNYFAHLESGDETAEGSNNTLNNETKKLKSTKLSAANVRDILTNNQTETGEDDPLQAGLLQASYSARLLAEKLKKP